MGKGSNLGDLASKDKNDDVTAYYTWQEVKESKSWIVIHDEIYNVAQFRKKHPGGDRILKNQLGQDATDAFVAFHTDMVKTGKYMKALRVGRVFPETEVKNQFEQNKSDLTNDFRELRATAERMGLFEKNKIFFLLHFLSIVCFNLGAWAILKYLGVNWYTYSLAVALLVTAQAQSGWLQHDFGHLSFSTNNKINHLMQSIVCSMFKGASCDWWNYRHNRHHAKPNVHHMDPDIRFDWLFVLGTLIPREKGHAKIKGILPFQLQHIYFFFIVPPLVLPIIFILDNLYYLYATRDLTRREKLIEFSWVASFFVIWFMGFGPIMGGWAATRMFFLVRFFESHWFIWITQMSHLPMEVDHDRDLSWFKLQLEATCNVEPSAFNDWFSGHLNYQIEHHLFPTMPRCHYHKIKPLVESLCKKYEIPYLDKTLTGAVFDIYHSLKASGELWYEAYHL